MTTEVDAYIAPAETDTLIALLGVYRRDGRATVRSVAAETGRSISTEHTRLLALADLGLVSHDRCTAGTLRPLVRLVG